MGAGIKKLPRTLDSKAQLQCRVRRRGTRPHGALNGTELASSWKRQCETVGERGGFGFGLYSGGINGEGEGVGGGN